MCPFPETIVISYEFEFRESRIVISTHSLLTEVAATVPCMIEYELGRMAVGTVSVASVGASLRYWRGHWGLVR